jgi:hypothetical protein
MLEIPHKTTLRIFRRDDGTVYLLDPIVEGPATITDTGDRVEVKKRHAPVKVYRQFEDKNILMEI